MLTSDPWLSDILDRPVYKLTVGESFEEKAKDSNNHEYTVLKSKPLFVYAKTLSDKHSEVKVLENLGFHLVETNIVFNRPISLTPQLADNCEIRFALPADEIQVVDLAGRTIVYSRFHQDDNFTKEIADKIKGEWVRNYFFGKRGQAMVVGVINKLVVGFLQLFIDGKDGIMRIDLIGVDKNYQRKGIGKDMIAFAEMNSQGIKYVWVGTQIVNVPSIRFYQSLGFNMVEAHYVFHYHNL